MPMQARLEHSFSQRRSPSAPPPDAEGCRGHVSRSVPLTTAALEVDMLRSSLLLTPTLALALVAMPATAPPGHHGSTASHVHANTNCPTWNRGSPAGSTGGRRIR